MASLAELRQRMVSGIRETSRIIQKTFELPTHEELSADFPHAQNCKRGSQLSVVLRKTYLEGSGGAWNIGSGYYIFRYLECDDCHRGFGFRDPH